MRGDYRSGEKVEVRFEKIGGAIFLERCVFLAFRGAFFRERGVFCRGCVL